MASRISPRSTAVSLVAIASFCGIASAGDTPNFLMTWDAGNDGIGPNTYNWGQFGNNNGYGDWTVGEGPLQSGPWTGWSYSGELPGPGGNLWNLQWNCVFNNNVSGVAAGGSAFVTANIVVTNSDVINQNFTLLMTLPVAAKVYPGERGSIIGTVTDIFGDGATVLAPAGGQIYTPRIDGVNEVPGYLMNDPFSQAAPGFSSVLVGPANFGVVAPSQAVDTSIAIFLSFDLTPGDSASFTSIFEILVPGPGGLAVFAALGLLRRRRR
jgi:hypothetical protein